MATSLPPGPRLPALVQQLHWLYRPTEYMQECTQRYGDVFTVRAPGYPPLVFFSRPELIKQVFAGDPEVLLAGVGNALLRPILGDNSVLVLDGPKHQKERKLMLPAFHGERMLRYGELMREAADKAIDRWPAGKSFALHPWMQRVTMEVILRAVFGVERADLLARFTELMERMLGMVGRNPAILLVLRGDGTVRGEGLLRSLGPLTPWGRYHALGAKLDALLFEEIRKRRASGAGEDVLSLLLTARHEDGTPMSDQELRDEMLTLVMAGHETTATALIWATYHLLANPDALAQARAEVHGVVGDGTLSGGHVPQLEYLDAAIKESHRLRPVLPLVARVVAREYQLGEWLLPKGTGLNPCIWLTNRRKDLWGDPERFRPERFLDKKPLPHEYFPFGGGARRCIGMAMANYETKVVLAQMLLRTQLRIADGYRPRMRRRGITFAMAEGLPVIAERLNPRRAAGPSSRGRSSAAPAPPRGMG
jgi:cytochrome P450